MKIVEIYIEIYTTILMRAEYTMYMANENLGYRF